MRFVNSILQHLQDHFPAYALQQQVTADEIPTVWVAKENIIAVIQYLKSDPQQSFSFLYDLCGIDERNRTKKTTVPLSDFTVVYHLFSYHQNHFIRIKVALQEAYPSLPSITSVYKNANWYEREVYDMFGIRFEGHPDLRRMLLPEDWDEGHPLRKDYPIRGYKQYVQPGFDSPAPRIR
ncbi:MAG TPA: NADH-quinone oxidoreductase subunit C, partial [Agriterribacter sp.]|nr:NADH-quinone oxidoreductase subunit C [Agriterribacter sp.]